MESSGDGCSGYVSHDDGGGNNVGVSGDCSLKKITESPDETDSELTDSTESSHSTSISETEGIFVDVS